MNPHRLTHCFIISVATLAAFSTAYGGTLTDWHETEGGDVRIVIESARASEENALPPTVRGAVEINLNGGWHTYWLEPGASGIPATFQFVPWSDVKSVELDYPAPQWVSTKYGDYAGYSAPVSLPFTIETAGLGKVKFEGSLLLGICEQICIPVMVPFSLDISATNASATTDMTVRSAFADLPAPAPAGMFDVSWDKDALQVMVSTTMRDFEFFASVGGYQAGRPIKKADGGDTIGFSVPLYPSGYDQGDYSMTLVITDGATAYAYTAALPPG